MDLGTAYIPTDRLQAMARGEALPEFATGTALFADVSGFTPLTESLIEIYGPKRGPEELSNYLNIVYDLLLAEVQRYGGSVISFAGDAITCWFDNAFTVTRPALAALVRSTAPAAERAAERAAACALNMQRIMARFATFTVGPSKTMSLTVKIALATGTVRRFVIGNPDVQLIDAMAGRLLMQLSEAEHLAHKNEVLIDAATADTLGSLAELIEWRTSDTDFRCAVLQSIKKAVPEARWPVIATGKFSEAQIRPWLHRVVFERLRTGKGDFLAELRMAVPVFVRISDLDYDEDARAPERLDAYIRKIQAVVQRYDGALLQLIIGDKGSVIYIVFGAPQAHEDDPVRAVHAALELRKLKLDNDGAGADDGAETPSIQIGMSQGPMRTGAYGSTHRRTYSVIGDEVNLAARLMQAAAPGEILVAQRIWDATRGEFSGDALPAITVKGKSRPIAIYRVRGVNTARSVSDSVAFDLARYRVPMVGRIRELETVLRHLDEAKAGKGQIIGLCGEAGSGKSRLAAEVIARAQAEGWTVLVGEAQSFGTQSSYLMWQPICRVLFAVDPDASPVDQLRQVEMTLLRIDPALVARAPLVGAVLGVPLPDNDLTAPMDAKLRKASLEALLADVVRSSSAHTSLLLTLEDCHWMDPLSADLLETIARAIVIADRPICLLMAYRLPPLPAIDRIAGLANTVILALDLFDLDEARQLLSVKAALLFGEAGQRQLPDTLVRRIYEQSEGNPFYIDEMLNYLHDRNVDVFDPAALAKLALPDSLQRLILSRIDQLNEDEKVTLKIASAIGRLFKVAVLWGVLSSGGMSGPASPAPSSAVDTSQTDAELNNLARANMLVREPDEPELTYLFKHVLTQEAAYESLPYATRSVLHNRIARYIERTFPDQLDSLVDVLVFHYDRSPDVAKRREYLLKAGQHAQRSFANAAAIDYYRRLLPLLSNDVKVDVMLRLGQVLETVGNWSEADTLYQDAELTAAQLGDRLGQARCLAAMGDLLRRQGQFAAASSVLERARTEFEQLDDQAGIARVLHVQGTLMSQQGVVDEARDLYERSLNIRQMLDDKLGIGSLLSNLGIVAFQLGDLDEAQCYFEASLQVRSETNDKWSIAVSLNNLGNLAFERSDYQGAKDYVERAIAINREIGDRSSLAVALNNLGNATRDQGDYAAAGRLYREALQINQAMGDKRAIAYLLEDLGSLAGLAANPQRAIHLIIAASVLRESIGAPLSSLEQERLEGVLAAAQSAVAADDQARIADDAANATLEATIVYALNEVA